MVSKGLGVFMAQLFQGFRVWGLGFWGFRGSGSLRSKCLLGSGSGSNEGSNEGLYLQIHERRGGSGL